MPPGWDVKKSRTPLIRSRNAAIGIGSMIIFIAMVLVAGIAAAVLIQTSNSLEITAMTSSQETSDEFATGLRVLDIMGYYSTRNVSGTEYSRIHNMTITVTPRAGSTEINLERVIIEISNSDIKCVLKWEDDAAYDVDANGVFSTDVFDLTADEFGIIALYDDDSSINANAKGLNDNDKAILSLNLSATFNGGLAQRKDVWGMVIPETGSPGVFIFRSPPAYADTLNDLY
jgi:flagellin FlaB